MKLKQSIILIIAVFLLGFGTTMVVYASFFAPEIRFLDAEFKVTAERVAGLNADTDAVRFGTVSQGNRGIRSVDVNHGKTHPVTVSISVIGEGMQWISVSQNNFVLQPLEQKRLDFYIDVPGDAPVGNYSGKIQFKFRRAFS